MTKHKFTVILIPDETSYQVIIPHYPSCTTCGETVEEALANAKEAMELLLEVEAEQGADPVPHNVYAEHVVVGAIDIEVPEQLIEPLEATTAQT